MYLYLDKEQREKLDSWDKNHNCEFKGYSGAIGGRLTYCFTPTSLGTIVVVECECEDKIDLTDYNW